MAFGSFVFISSDAQAQTAVPLTYNASSNGWKEVLVIKGPKSSSFNIKIRGAKDPKTGKPLSGTFRVKWKQPPNADSETISFSGGSATTKKVNVPPFTFDYDKMTVQVIVP